MGSVNQKSSLSNHFNQNGQEIFDHKPYGYNIEQIDEIPGDETPSRYAEDGDKGEENKRQSGTSSRDDKPSPEQIKELITSFYDNNNKPSVLRNEEE